MSKIEELIYSALEHGQRNSLFERVTQIKLKYPNKPLEDVYDEAYSDVMKTI